jgi:ATP-dependent Clp protease ATP-binding subunit ClpC
VALLRQQDMSVDEIRAQVEREAKPGGSSQPRPDLPYTSRSKRVLEFAMSEAREMGDGYVDTGHLLLALSRDKRDLGAHVLNTQGFSRDAARDALRALHAAGSEDPGGAVPQALAVLPPEQAARMLDRIARAERYAPVFKAHGIDVDKLIADIRGTK